MRFANYRRLKEDVAGSCLWAQEARTIVPSDSVHDLLEMTGHLYGRSRLDSVSIRERRLV